MTSPRCAQSVTRSSRSSPADRTSRNRDPRVRPADADRSASLARRRRGHDRTPCAVSTADARIEWYRADERQLVARGEVTPAAGAEDVGALIAVRADEAAHVLDDAEDRHVELAEHLDATT